MHCPRLLPKRSNRLQAGLQVRLPADLSDEFLGGELEQCTPDFQILVGPVPPAEGLQSFDRRFVKPEPYQFGRDAANNRIRRDIARDNRASRYHGTVSDSHSGHDHRTPADPDVMSDVDWTSRLKLFHADAEIPDRKGRGGMGGMFGPKKKQNFFGNGAEMADIEPRGVIVTKQCLRDHAIGVPANGNVIPGPAITWPFLP